MAARGTSNPQPTVTIIGKKGRLNVNESDLPYWREKGYKLESEADPADIKKVDDLERFVINNGEDPQLFLSYNDDQSPGWSPKEHAHVFDSRTAAKVAAESLGLNPASYTLVAHEE